MVSFRSIVYMNVSLFNISLVPSAYTGILILCESEIRMELPTYLDVEYVAATCWTMLVAGLLRLAKRIFLKSI